MQIKNSVFLSLIGDYYLHTNKLKNQHIFINNKVSLLIDDYINSRSDCLLGNLLNCGNKNEIYLGYFELNINNNLIIKDINGKQIDVIAYISPYDGKIYQDKNTLIKQCTTYREKQGLLYFFKTPEYLLLIDQSLKKLHINDVTKAILQKFIYFSPENYLTVRNLLSILFGSPVSMAIDGETIISISDNEIITDKNIYQINGVAFLRKPGEKINFLEPIYYKCEIAPNNITKDILYLKLLKAYKADPLYAQKLIDTINSSYLYIKVPLETFIENQETIQDLNFLKNKFKIIKLNTVAKLESGAKQDIDGTYIANATMSSKEKIIYKTNASYTTEEEYSITTSFFKTKDDINIYEEQIFGLKNKEKFYSNIEDKSKAIKYSFNQAETKSTNKNINYQSSSYSMEETNHKKSILFF
jgi:hypothetical protein